MAALKPAAFDGGGTADRAGWWYLALLGLVGALHGVWLVGPILWSVDAPFWKAPPGDIAVGVVGLEAFLQDAWQWPLAATGRLLSDGQSVSIAYTDSLPLLAIVLKLLGVEASTLPPFGLAIFLGQILQPIAAGWALRRAGLTHWSVIVPGALLLACAPFWFFRLAAQHLALTWHWQILLTLGLALGWCRARRITRGEIAGALALCAAASATHAYLALQVVAVLLSGCLVLLAGKRLLAALALALGLTGAVIVGAAVVGLWPPPKAGLTIGPYITKPGHHSFNLLGPLDFSYSAIWHASRPIDATRGQYEGMSYVGAGVLLLIALLTIVAACRFLAPLRLGQGDHGGQESIDLRRFWPLFVVASGLVFVALFPDLWLGNDRLISLPIPAITAKFWEQFRSNGRFIWPVLYLLVILVIVATVQSMGLRRAGIALTVAVGLQLLDGAILRHGIRTMVAAPSPALPADFPVLRAAGALGGNVRLRPSWACLTFLEAALGRVISLEVVRAGGVVHQPPMARGATADCDPSRIARDDGLAGVTDMIFRRSLSRADLVELLRRRDCAVGEALLACRGERPRALAPDEAFAQLLPEHSVLSGVRYPIAQGQPGADWLYHGWSGPEVWGTWSDGPSATLLLPSPASGDAHAIDLQVTAYSALPSRRQNVLVTIAGKEVWQGELEASKTTTIRLPVDADALKSKLVPVRFQIGHPQSPISTGASQDARMLGIGLLSVEWKRED